MEDQLQQKRFLWAVLLAWTPWIPALVGIAYTVSGSKATGVAAVAGGMVELLVLWGIGTMIVAQVAAIVWLFRSFSRTNVLRSVFSAASICASGLMLFLVTAFLLWGRSALR